MTPQSVLTTLTTDDARRLNNANDPAAGVVVVARVPPALRRRHELGLELLAALGVNPELAGGGRHMDDDWEILAALCELDLWLVAEDSDDAYLDLAAAHAHRSTTLDALNDLLTHLHQALHEPTPARPVAYPSVPATNFMTFRAVCRDRLSAHAFTTVDTTYRAAHTAAIEVLGAHDTLDEDTVVTYLRDVVDRYPTVDEILVAVRATQAAAFNLGHLVQVRLARLLATAEASPTATVHSPATWARLGAYRAPYRATACALAATGFSTDEMRATTIGDVDPTGATVTRARDGISAPVSMPAGAEVHVRTQLLL